MSQCSVSFVPSYRTFCLYIVSCYSDGELLLTRIHMSFSLLHFLWLNIRVLFIIIIISPLFTSFEGDKPDPPGNISMGGTAKKKVKKQKQKQINK